MRTRLLSRSTLQTTKSKSLALETIPHRKTIDDLSDDAVEALSLLRKQDNYLKNLVALCRWCLMDGYSSTMLKFMFDATDLTPSRMEIRKAVLANEPLTPKQKEEVFDFDEHDHPNWY